MNASPDGSSGKNTTTKKNIFNTEVQLPSWLNNAFNETVAMNSPNYVPSGNPVTGIGSDFFKNLFGSNPAVPTSAPVTATAGQTAQKTTNALMPVDYTGIVNKAYQSLPTLGGAVNPLSYTDAVKGYGIDPKLYAQQQSDAYKKVQGGQLATEAQNAKMAYQQGENKVRTGGVGEFIANQNDLARSGLGNTGVRDLTESQIRLGQSEKLSDLFTTLRSSENAIAQRQESVNTQALALYNDYLKSGMNDLQGYINNDYSRRQQAAQMASQQQEAKRQAMIEAEVQKAQDAYNQQYNTQQSVADQKSQAFSILDNAFTAGSITKEQYKAAMLQIAPEFATYFK